MLPLEIDSLAEKLRYFPGIGTRSSQKLALDILELDQEKFDELIAALENARERVKFCDNCGFFAQISNQAEQNSLCEICKNVHRTNSQICLVERAVDVISLEKTEIYRGKYHILNSLISPLENIFPEDTTIVDLLDRRLVDLIAQKKENPDKEKFIELILFFKAGFAADATTAYLRESIAQKKMGSFVKITRLAQGLPMYYNPQALDQATISKALEDRREVD